MADRQSASRRSTSERQSPPRRNDVIRCEKCGEDYSITYKRCPFCDERPGRGGISGRRVANNTRGGGYGGPVNPIQIVGLVISLVLIIAALFIVFTKIAPLFSGGREKPDGSVSTSQSSGGSHSSAGSNSSSASSSSSGGDVSEPGLSSVSAEAVSLSKEDFTLNPGESYSLVAAVSPSGVTDPIVWSSSDSSVAVVDENGNVTNVNQSGAKKTITITASCGDRSASCIVRCESATPSGGNTTPGPSNTGTVSPNTPGTITNAENGLNIRSGPGSSYERVASAPNGAKIVILEDSGNGWYKIDYGNGKIGYVSRDYVAVGN